MQVRMHPTVLHMRAWPPGLPMSPGGLQGPQLPATSLTPLSAHRDPAPVNKQQHQNCGS